MFDYTHADSDTVLIINRIQNYIMIRLGGFKCRQAELKMRPDVSIMMM